MNILGENFTLSSCWNNIGDYNGSPKYMEITGEEKKNIYTNSDDYAKGEKKSDSNSSYNADEKIDELK